MFRMEQYQSKRFFMSLKNSKKINLLYSALINQTPQSKFTVLSIFFINAVVRHGETEFVTGT